VRFALLALLVACKQEAPATKAPPSEPAIAVPGGTVQPLDAALVVEAAALDATVDAPPAVTGAVEPPAKRGIAAPVVGRAPPIDAGVVDSPPAVACACTPPSASTKERSRDTTNHLRAEQGTLRVTGTDVTLTAATGWHIATDYNIKLYLEPSDGVSLERAPLTAGGRSKASGDASVLSEQTLTFRVAARGKGEIAGILSFGICEADSCHPRLQPITINVTAN
jgi:hypothetical protein